MIDTFTHTSAEPYDRHHYHIELNTGDKILFHTYEQVRNFWFQYLSDQSGCVVTILDKKPKKKSGVGF